MRIVSLVPSHTETLFYLGLGEQVVGVTEHCDYPPEAGDRERVGYFGRPNLSRISSLEPDLVVAGGSVHLEIVEQLRQAGVDVFDFQPLSVVALLEGMETLLRLTADENSISRVDSLRTRLHRLEEIGSASKQSPRLVFLAGGADMHVPGRSNWQYDAFRLCGTRPLPAAGDALFVHVTWADIKAFEPDIILACGRRGHEQPPRQCPGCNVENPPCARDIAVVQQDIVLHGVMPVRPDHVYPVACHAFCRPGPRLFAGMEWLVSLIGDHERR
jgi:iron complex transport system substrate-binding protein